MNATRAFVIAISFALLLSFTANSFAQTDTTWTFDGDGLWTTAANWDNGDPGAGANPNFNAFIDDGDTAVTVTLNVGRSIQDLTIGADDALGIASGGGLTIGGGSLANDGTITINSNGANSDVSIFVNGTDLDLTGTGQIVLNNQFGPAVPQRASLNSGFGVTITQGADHTIRGNGRIQAALINNGTVSADDSSLFLTGEDKVNNSIFQAINGAELDIRIIDVTNTNGTITAADASTVALRANARIIGGVLNTTGSGQILADFGSGFLQDVTLNGTLNITGGDNLQLENALTNNGVITLNSNGANSDTQINAVNSLTIDGTGEIVLNNAFGSAVPQRASLNSAAGETLTQGADHTISGRGQITAALVNNGLVTANVSGDQLVLNTNGKTNNSDFLATDGGVLVISAIEVANTSGTITADNGTVAIGAGAEIVGGTLDSANGGVFLANFGAAVLDGVTNNATFDIVGNNNLQLEDGLTNNGVITVNSNGANLNTQINAVNTLTIDGTGEIVLNNNFGTSVPERASIDAATGETITQGADHTISGRGRITAALINNGLVSANVSGEQLVLNTNNKTNNSDFLATNTGVLVISAIEVANTSGTITADNGTVAIGAGAEIVGGTLESANGGVFLANFGAAVLDGVTNNATFDIVGNNNLQLEDGLTNNGVITVNSNGANLNTQINAVNTLTIDGTGEIVLNNNFGTSVPERASIDAAAGETITQGADHTLSGRGRITAALINNGLVTANVSAGQLVLNTNNKTNNSDFLATDGGVLVISAIEVDNSSGTIAADNGTVAIGAGAEIVGGTLDSANGGVFLANFGAAVLDGVINNATFDIVGNNNLQLENGLTNNGTITVNSNGVNLNTQVNAVNTLTIDGTGEIVLNNNIGISVPERASIDAATGETITQGADHTISGKGRITATLINDGTVSAEGGLLQLRDGDKTNNGVFQALDGATLSMLAGTTLTNNVAGVLTGGTYRVIDGGNGASMSLNGAPITEVAAGTEIVLSGPNSALTVGGVIPEDTTTINRGTVRILDNRDYLMTANVMTFDNFGVLELGGGTLDGIGLVQALANMAGGEFFGFGALDGPLSNGGLVRANGGTLTIQTILGQGGGTAQIDAAASLDVSDPTFGDSSATNLLHNGADLNLGANNFLVDGDYDNANFGVGNAFNHRANVTGAGQILADPAVAQTLTGDVADGNTATPSISFGNIRVGDTSTQSYAVNNVGASGPNLRGAIQTDDSAGNGGNLTDSQLSGSGVTASNYGPVAVGSATSNFDVTFTPTSAGGLAGQQVAIVNNFDNVAGQTLSIAGAAYNAADPDVSPTTVDFGIIHVGDLVAQFLTIANNAPAGAFSEDLRADNFNSTDDASVSAPAMIMLAAAASDIASASVSVDTTTAGAKTGTVTIDLTSTGEVQGAAIAGLGELDLGTETINISAQVNNFAEADVAKLSGAGAFSMTGADEFLLDFGTILVGNPSPNATLGVVNDAVAPADDLAGDFTTSGAAFAFTGFNAFSGLLANDTFGGLNVSFDTSNLGTFTGQITLDPRSENASGFSSPLGQVVVNITGMVVIPEPATVSLCLLSVAALCCRRRRLR